MEIEFDKITIDDVCVLIEYIEEYFDQHTEGAQIQAIVPICSVYSKLKEIERIYGAPL